MRKLLSLTLLCFCFDSIGQTIRWPVRSDYADYNTYSISDPDAFSFSSNQASLVQIKKFNAGIYSERRFMLSELSLYNVALALPTHSGNFGLKAGYYGSVSFNEMQVGLAYGRKLGGKIDLGVQFNYYSVKVAHYGNAAAIGCEAGIIMHVTTKLNAGVHVGNPVGGKFGNRSDEKLPFVYTSGLGYEASGQLFITAELEKEEGRTVDLRTVVCYKFRPQVAARLGFSTVSSNGWLGIAFTFKSLRIDFTAGYHPQLGATPGLLLLYHVPDSIPHDKAEP